MRPVLLKDYDPSDFLYNYQKTRGDANLKQGQSRCGCYLAPEQFYNREFHEKVGTKNNKNVEINQKLTDSMDIFSAGCVIIEIFLSTPCFDLGDLMEYRTLATLRAQESTDSSPNITQTTSNRTIPPSLKQKLNKIESSSMRAACKHMLSIDPKTRLSASQYIEKLSVDNLSKKYDNATTTSTKKSTKTCCFPPCFEEFLWPFLQKFTSISNNTKYWTHDARVALIAKEYAKGSLRCMMQEIDFEGEDCFKSVLGSTIFDSNNTMQTHNSVNYKKQEEPQLFTKPSDLLAETEKLLIDLESSLLSPSTQSQSQNESLKPNQDKAKIDANDSINIPQNHKASSTPAVMIILLQFLLSSLRHINRPSIKLLALQLLLYFHKQLPVSYRDETGLQRIIPFLMVTLDDINPLVRAQSIRVLTSILSQVQKFSPSDAKLFPCYILKGLIPLTMPEEVAVVRVAFAECLGTLATTSKRFLDVSHAMRLQDALDGGGGGNVPTFKTKGSMKSKQNVGLTKGQDFSDDLAQLLGDTSKENNMDTASSKKSEDAHSSPNEISQTSFPTTKSSSLYNTTLIPNTYDEELQQLQDTFSLCFSNLTTSSATSMGNSNDVRNASSLSCPFIKTALLRSSLSQLAIFFGEQGTISRLLPTILTFWNDTHYEIRAALCQALPGICHVIGQVATEEYVIPCVEVACCEKEEYIVAWAMWCLSALVEQRLVTNKQVLLGDQTNTLSRNEEEHKTRDSGLLQKYAPLLFHPSPSIRNNTASLFCASCRAIGFPDDEIFVLPIIRPFLRFEPSRKQLQTKFELLAALLPFVPRNSYDNYMNHNLKSKGTKVRADETDVALQSDNFSDFEELGFQSINIIDDSSQNDSPETNSQVELSSKSNLNHGIVGHEESKLLLMKNYIEMVNRNVLNPFGAGNSSKRTDFLDDTGKHIQLSSAYSFGIPNQKYIELVSHTLPGWFEQLRSIAENETNSSSSRNNELCALKTLSSIMQVYGLSIVLPSSSNQPRRKWKGDSSFDMLKDAYFLERQEKSFSQKEIENIFCGTQSKVIASAIQGELGSIATQDPLFNDATTLRAKLQCLGVPSLPPRLGCLREVDGRVFSWHSSVGAPSSKDDLNDENLPIRNDWKPKVDSLVVSSSETNEHTGAVSRLAVAQDQSFFVSASHDGTSRVFELRQVEDCVDLQSSLTYSGHITNDKKSDNSNNVRLNDVCIVENSHSVATASSNGSVHIWRVDIASSSSVLSGNETGQPSRSDMSKRGNSSTDVKYYEASRVSGSSLIREVNPKEGEILTVNHFNTPSSSNVLFSTQRGIHSWDIRCSTEPFFLPVRPELGYVTSVGLGSDRNWIVAGTNRGFLALWDIRYRLMLKLWQHSDGAPISRLATSFTTLPQDKDCGGQDRPHLFMGCGLNEAAVFDVNTGQCRQCYRTLDPSLCYTDQLSLPEACLKMPELIDISLPSHHKQPILPAMNILSKTIQLRTPPPEPSVMSIMGRIGNRGQNYLITGGSDGYIRYWDFMNASKCYTISGLHPSQPKPSYEDVNVGPSGKLFLCRQVPTPVHEDGADSSRKSHVGCGPPDQSHRDAILDLKNVDFPMKGLLSASRDGVIKLWK